MSTPNIFIPSNQVVEKEMTPTQTPNTILFIKKILTTLAQSLVVLGIGLLPLLFIIGNDNILSFDRVVFASVLAGAAVIVTSILLLFQKRVSTVLPTALSFLAAFTVWGLVSAYAQGDSYDSIWGRNIESLTVTFSLLLLVFSSLPLILQSSTKMLIRALALIQGVALVVLLHTFLWYWFGFSVLGFGELTSMSQSLVGGFNDSAIYVGLVVLFGLTALVMLPLRAYAQTAVSFLLVLALLLLLLINFTRVWVVLLIISTVTTGYVFLRRFLFQNVVLPPISGITKFMSLVALGTAIVAVMYGSSVADSLSKVANTQFVEVIPTFEASAGIVREVYQDDMFFGVGPNRYEDAWRMYKDAGVNEGVFWNTDFQTGDSYMISVFTTHGVIGGLLLLLFQLFFIWFGLSRLINNANDNIILRYVATSIFTGAVFLWVMTYVYTPGVTLLLLAASLTGLTFAAGSALDESHKVTVDIISNRIRGFVVLLVSVLLITVTVLFVCSVISKYSEQANVSEVVTTYNDEVAGKIANVRINELSQLIATANPESVTQEDLLEVSKEALAASKEAIDLDPTNPVHHKRLASLYGILGAIGVDGAYKNAKSTLKTVIKLDPKNPSHHLATARILLAESDLGGAQVSLEKAMDLKFNYTEAIQLQTNIAIANNDTADTIVRVEGIAQLEPGNATRWYQLGLLYAASEETEDAITVLLRALRIDPSYADARYVLALQYLSVDRRDEALSQLRIVKETNTDNAQLLSLIESVENGEEIEILAESPAFDDGGPSVDIESGISVPSGVSDDLFSPVNQGG